MKNNRLKEYRERAGLSQTELAWRAKMAGQNISAIERGTLAPWPRARKSLAEALQVGEAELFPKECDNG
jgi:transcriptional regulator with XRE-family HTH domain